MSSVTLLDSSLEKDLGNPAGDGSRSDAGAIAELDLAFAAAHRAFAGHRFPTLKERAERLQALIHMMLQYRVKISDALSSDFGCHPVPASDLIEVLGVVGRAGYALEHLAEWMAPATRETNPAVHGTARASIHYQPKGVIGNIVPWNFPFDLSVGPLIEMLASGNRVVIKPSEYTPACSELLREMVSSAFDPALVSVAVGGLSLARHFATLRWDHLLYTGSPAVGRSIMAAAAQNLTPVTLELGGKCPALMTPGSVSARSVESVIGTKLIKNGQMCISVDYCLVPREELSIFITHAQSYMAQSVPGYSRGADCTGIISHRHLDRLASMLQDAEQAGCQVITLEDDGRIDHAGRRMPLNLVVDPPRGLRLMREEIFGPLLPVIPYDDLDQAIASINAGERPLGLYVFGDDDATTDRVLAETHSGGAAVNACALQGALPSLAFGGVGMSGMGRHHGIEGFREFSNPRGIVIRGSGDIIDSFHAPYSKAAAVVKAALSS